jgi:hypothetical protein
MEYLGKEINYNYYDFAALYLYRGQTSVKTKIQFILPFTAKMGLWEVTT